MRIPFYSLNPEKDKDLPWNDNKYSKYFRMMRAWK